METIVELEERLGRYPADRYPVQRATTLFHLGVALTSSRPDRARHFLTESAALFERCGLEVEGAKARNALGAALRELGEPDAAAVAFRGAADMLPGGTVERGAALFNLALVQRRAAALLDEAREIFAAAGARREEAAALRELGAAHLEDGDVPDAVSTLEAALELAHETADDAGVGAAANALGLAYLAAGRPGDAVDALREAASANPRSVRPHEHAMAKANLAVAYEGAGDPRRARLAARQALGVPSAPAPVRDQARAALARLGDGDDDLVAVLAEEPRDRWAALVREEVVRWADADDATLAADAAALSGTYAEALLGALLELPPDEMERILGALLAVGRRAELERAAALFHAPQELRLRETIARLERRRSSSAT